MHGCVYTGIHLSFLLVGDQREDLSGSSPVGFGEPRAIKESFFNAVTLHGKGMLLHKEKKDHEGGGQRVIT